MSERRTRTKEQSLWFALVWVVTLAAMVGLGVLLGKYVLSYCASSLQVQQPSKTQTRTSMLPVSQEPYIKVDEMEPDKPDIASHKEEQTSRNTNGIIASSSLYRVQTGEFYDKQEAEKVANILADSGYPVYITPEMPFRIQVGAFQDKDNADSLAKELETQGYPVIIKK